MTLPEGDIEVYDINGKILSRKNAWGIGWTLSYSSGKLIKVTHSNGKTIQLVWVGNQDRISTVIDPHGNKYSFGYRYEGSKDRLIGYDGWDTPNPTFHYGENGVDVTYLTGISFGIHRYSTYLYNSSGKATQSGRSDGTQNDKLSYSSNFTTVTNPLGAVSKYIYTNNNKDKLSKIERSGVSNCPDSSASTSYDSNGYISSKTDWNGIETKYDRDSYGRVIKETAGIKNSSETNAQITKTTWLNSPSLVSKVEYFNDSASSAIQDVTYNYYSANESAKHRIKSIKTCSKTGTTTCNTIGYGYSFHSNGMPSAIAISRNDKTTTYSYDSTGNLTQIKNALGQTIEYSNYDGLGNVGKITDANGLIIEYVYNTRGRVTSKKETLATDQVRTTTYQYHPYGLSKTENPDGVKETIHYNENGTISRIGHGSGAYSTIDQFYQYSKLGKLLNVEYKDSNSRFSQSNTHNQLGWTTADKGNNSQNIRYEYDGNGNIIKQTDSLGKITSYSYDSQNHLIEEKRPDGATITNSYDQAGNLLSVTDGKKSE